MDQIDKEIISILKENSRISYKEISNKVYLSQPTVKERILKLIENKEITKFTIETKNMQEKILAFLYIKTVKCKELEKFLSKSVFIMRMYRMSGAYNYCIEICAESVNELLLFQKSLRKYGASQLHIVTEEVI